MALVALIFMASSAAAPAFVPVPAAPPLAPMAPLSSLAAIADEPAVFELPAAGAGRAPQVRPRVRLVLKTGVVARDVRLTLADVADCFGTPTLCDETYAIDVGPSPDPGKTAAMTPAKLAEMLAREWPEADVTVEGTPGKGGLSAGKRPVRIVSEAADLDEEELTQAFAAQLQDLVGEDKRLEVEIGRVRVNGKPKVRPGGCRFVFPELTSGSARSPDWAARHLNGSKTFRVTCLDPRKMDAPDGGDATGDADDAFAEGESALGDGDGAMPTAVDGDSFTVTASLTLRQLVPVAGKDLERDVVVRAEDVDEAWMDMGKGQKILTETASVTGRRLRRTLAAGEVFPAGALEVPIAVRRGQTVSLKVVRGGLTVYGKAQVLANGGYGDVVEATYPATKKKFRVRVVDATTVDYLF